MPSLRSCQSSVLLFLFLLFVYHGNFRSISSGDAYATRVLPLSLLLQGNLYVDQFAAAYLGKEWPIDTPLRQRHYSTRFQREHWLSAYPVVTPVLIAPLYLPLAWFLVSSGLPYDDPLVLQLISLMEKVTVHGPDNDT